MSLLTLSGKGSAVIWVFGRHVGVQTMTRLLLFILVLLVLSDRPQTLASPSEPAAFDGPAELPRTYVESSLRATPASWENSGSTRR